MTVTHFKVRLLAPNEFEMSAFEIDAKFGVAAYVKKCYIGVAIVSRSPQVSSPSN